MGAVQNYVGVSRRPPDVEDYIDMLRRHRSWIVGPTYLGLVIAVVVAFFRPDTFESSAIMRITPQTISERVVPETIDLQMSQVLEGLRTKILSRTSLTTLISNPKLKLYPQLVKNQTTEDAVAQMQKDVSISPWAVASAESATGRGQGAFIIRFRYPNKYKARDVVEELVSEFTSQDVTLQSDAAKQTRGFLTDQLKEAQDRLNTIQTNVARFREENAGRLPDNAIYNANQLSSLETQMAAAGERISNLQMDRRNMQNNLQSNEDLLTYMTSSAQGAPAEDRVSQNLANLDRQIQSEEASLAGLRQTYRDDFPTVKSQQAKINSLKQQRDQEAAKQTAKPDEPAKSLSPVTTANIQQQKDRIQSIQTQIDNLDLEVKRATESKADLLKHIDAVRAKIESSPEVEQKYSELTQDLTFAKSSYDELVKKEKESETTQDIQERHLGEQLELLDQASLPTNPVDSNRWAISAIGAGMGLMIGLALAGAKEAKDASLKNLKDIRAYTNLPVLTSIPLLENALLVRRKRRLFWLAWTTAGIVGSAAMFISMMYYMTPKPQ
jgi:polysaccharide chain length determinant protein (PEP-CTERM system associated)